MSWTSSFQLHLHSWLCEEIDVLLIQNVSPPETASNEDFVTFIAKDATEAIENLLEVVTPDDGTATLAVTVSGHSNPNQSPQEGWANDCVSVSVSQVSVP